MIPKKQWETSPRVRGKEPTSTYIDPRVLGKKGSFGESLAASRIKLPEKEGINEKIWEEKY